MTLHPIFHSFASVNKCEKLTCITHENTQFRQTDTHLQRCLSPLFLSLSCVEAAICKYAEVVTVALDTHTHTNTTHNMSKGLCGVNIFEDIMPDHLIMTRPLGSRACLLFHTPYMLLIIQFSHNALQHYRFISQKGFKWLQRLTEESAVFQFSFTEGDNWCVSVFPSLPLFCLTNPGDYSAHTDWLWLHVHSSSHTTFLRMSYCLKHYKNFKYPADRHPWWFTTTVVPNQQCCFCEQWFS